MFIFSIIKEILLKWLVVGGKFITITKKKKKQKLAGTIYNAHTHRKSWTTIMFFF
jgi:hypothetical protein